VAHAATIDGVILALPRARRKAGSRPGHPAADGPVSAIKPERRL